MQRLGWRVSYPWREGEGGEEEEVEDDENEMARPTDRRVASSSSFLPYLSSDDEAVTVGLNSTRLYSSKEGRNSLFKWKPANLQNMIEAALLRPFVWEDRAAI